MKKVFKIEVDCAHCANKMEECASKVKGVRSAAVSFMTLKMTVDFEEGADIGEVMNNVLKACKRVERDCEIYF